MTSRKRSARSFLWTYADQTSQTITNGTTVAVNLLANFESQYGVKPWNATVTRVLAFLTLRTSAISNSLGPVNMLLGVASLDASVSDLPGHTEAADFMFWRRQYLSGPGGDSTALVNVQPPYLFEFDIQTQRIVSKPEDTIWWYMHSEFGSNVVWAASFRILLRMP